MKKFLGFLATMTIAMTAYAGFRAYSGTSDLKIFDSIKCSTGLTCTREGGKLLMVSSPSLTSELTLAGAEATDALLSMNADEGDDNADKWQLASVASGNAFTLSNKTSGSYVVKLSVAASDGDVTGPGTGEMSGFLQKMVAATATTITAAQCGSTFYNSGAVQIELPEASTAIGCRLTFVTLNAANFDVNPDDADQILVLTNAAGDMIRNATLGNTVTLQAVSASQWVQIGIAGTWSDAN